MKHLHGGDLAGFARRHPGKTALDFSANINPLGLPEGVRAAYLKGADASLHYPDPACRELGEALARYEGVPREWILCGNGASDLICRIAWGLAPKTALITAPTFAEYEQALTAAGCRVQRCDLDPEEDFALGEEFLDRIEGAELVFLCNPNNPTGRLIPRPFLEAVMDRCQTAGALLAVDECFLDFLPNPEPHTVKGLLGKGGGLLILRAFTKIFAMPGLRLGYLLCGNRELLARIGGAGAPWSVSVPAQLCGVAAAKEAPYLAETRRLLPPWREALAQGLQRLGCRVLPGAANFLCFQARPGLVPALEERGVLLRDCANFYGMGPGWYRTAVRTGEENQILLKELEGLL